MVWDSLPPSFLGCCAERHIVAADERIVVKQTINANRMCHSKRVSTLVCNVFGVAGTHTTDHSDYLLKL